MCSVENRNHKGTLAELEIAAAATKLGIPVYKPLSEHSRADLVLEIGSRLARVQCKWGRLSARGDVMFIRCGGSRRGPSGFVRSTYSVDEIDLLGVYCGALDRCFLLPVSLVADRHAIQLRLTPPRNRQRACINLAEDFDFEGAIAQLGERSAGSRKVAGSNPASSTSPGPDAITVGSNPFRDALGYWMERAAGGEEVIITFRGKPRIRLSPTV
jgi:PD-(D/E)XK endonuclease